MNIFSGHSLNALLYESPSTRLYRAIRLFDGLPVVVKLLREPVPSPLRRARFRQEFRLMQRLRLDVVPAVLGLESEQGRLAIVMEDFGGSSLDALQRSGRLFSRRTEASMLAAWLRLAIQITQRLEQLHAQHVIHKDLNPSNIVWNPDSGRLKLIDLGLATELKRETAEARSAERIEGTLAYISPEQTGRMNRAVDYRTDFYSLGVTLYELLTGRLPFESEDPMELVHAHIARLPTPVAELRPGIPAVVSAIVDKLMSKNAEDRYQSATGLVADLRACLSALDERGHIEEFALGSRDVSYRLEIPQKLYGREREAAELMRAYERAAEGAGELLLVTGYSGVGKSALVHELHKPVTAHRGHFAEGKFDQLKRDIPYSALIEAFGGLVRQLLTESDAEVRRWKQALLGALGRNGRAIAEVIPGLELLIGAQPELAELPAEQAQARFAYLFRRFVGALATAEHPLALFLDDLQWADLSSLELVAQLVRPPACDYLLVIGAYRDNEITPAHPLPRVLGELQRREGAVRTLTLAPLGVEQVRRLLGDTLHADEQAVDALAQLCLAKTQGNPFFLGQFLDVLVRRDMLYMDAAQQGWQWDVARIEQAGITGNVVELMVGRIRQLSAPAQRVLLGAACLGNAFDLAALAQVCALPAGEAAGHLWPALEAGLILPLDEHYRYAQQAGAGDAAIVPQYRFLHDRVRQAASTLGSDADKAAMHQAIGRIWLQTKTEEEQEALLFDLVNHLNLGQALLREQAERRQLARWNLRAARKAKASGAYRPGLRYVQTGLELLAAEDWETHPELIFDLHWEEAELACLDVDIARMEACLQNLDAHARNAAERARICELRVQALISQGRMRESVAAGVQGLVLLGIGVPARMTRAHILFYLLRFKRLLGARHAARLPSLPEAKDERILAVFRLLDRMTVAAYAGVPRYVMYLMYLKLLLVSRHGRVADMDYVYASAGVVLGGKLHAVDQATQLGRLALLEHEQGRMGMARYRTLFAINYFIRPWTEPLQDTVEPLRETYLRFMEIGDGDFASYSALGWCAAELFCGSRLPELDTTIAEHCAALEQIKRPVGLNALRALQRGTRDLMSGLGAWDLPKRVESEVVAHTQTVLFFFHCTRLMVSYLLHDYAGARQAGRDAAACFGSRYEYYGVSLVRFYDSLARLVLLESMPAQQRRRELAIVRRNQKELARSARFCAANFLHKWHLVEAELARCTGLPLQAAEHYERAIRLAAAHRFAQEEALANELAGAFYLQRGHATAAGAYLQRAHDGYLQWGALAKARQLQSLYPDLLAEPAGSPRRRTTLASVTADGGDAVPGSLDFMAAMKASQALSQEISLDLLLRRLMQVAFENAGAQRGVLLLREGERWRIAARLEEGWQQAALPALVLDETRADLLPQTLLRYVMRTRECLLVIDAARDRMALADPYVQVLRPRSLLLVPLLQHGKLNGLLYLEHNALPGVFTLQRMQMLQLLAAQAAISIENARLYADMEKQVAERTAELQAVSLVDALTGVANRRAFDDRLADELSRVRRHGQPLALLMLDIDHFKRVNDSYGHPAGDDCLRRIGRVLSAMPRRMSDFVARYGGEEFAILLPGTELAAAAVFAERVLAQVRGIELEIGAARHPITVSIGVAVAQAGGLLEPDALIARADECLYAAKRQGRDRVVAAGQEHAVPD